MLDIKLVENSDLVFQLLFSITFYKASLPLGWFQSPQTTQTVKGHEADEDDVPAGMHVFISIVWFLVSVLSGVGHTNSTGILVK